MRPSAGRFLTEGEKNLYPVKSLLCEMFTEFDKRLKIGAKPKSRDQTLFYWGRQSCVPGRSGAKTGKSCLPNGIFLSYSIGV